jgi:hypothetical protein
MCLRFSRLSKKLCHLSHDDVALQDLTPIGSAVGSGMLLA